MSYIVVVSLGLLLVRFLQLLSRRIRNSGPPRIPDVLDLIQCLAAATFAGKSVEEALTRYQPVCPPRLGTVLGRINARVALGSPLVDAIALEARRNKSEPLANIAGTVERSRSLGQPTPPALLLLAEELSCRYRAAEAKRVSRVAPLAGLLTALVIAPACVTALAVLAVGGALMTVAGQV